MTCFIPDLVRHSAIRNATYTLFREPAAIANPVRGLSASTQRFLRGCNTTVNKQTACCEVQF